MTASSRENLAKEHQQAGPSVPPAHFTNSFSHITTVLANVKEEEFDQLPSNYDAQGNRKKTEVPAGFPPLARFIGDFERKITNKDNNNTIIVGPSHKTHHDGYVAVFEGREYWVKTNEEDAKDSSSKYMFELQQAAWLRHFIASPETACPRAFPLFDYDFQGKPYFIGVASELIPEFKTNRELPLKEEHLTIHALDSDLGVIRDQLMEQLAILSETLKRKDDLITKGMKYLISFIYTPDPEASVLKPIVDAFIQQNKEQDFTLTQIGQFQIELSKRKEHLERLKKSNSLSDQQKNEIEPLETAFGLVTKFIGVINNPQPINVELFEKIDQYILDNQLDIGNTVSYPNENQKIPIGIDNTTYHIKIRDLRNNQTRKSLAKILARAFTDLENDLHNNNFGISLLNRLRYRIDFDMSLWHFFKDFKKPNFATVLKEQLTGSLMYVAEKLGYNSNNQPLDRKVEDIDNFPNINPYLLRYWPVYATLHESSSVGGTINKNFYERSHTSPFKKLADDDLFRFYAYSQFLRDVLVSDEMLRAANELVIRQSSMQNNDENNNKNLIDRLTEYEIKDLEKFRELLTQSKRFQEFIVKHGEFAFKTIVKNFVKDKTALQTRINAGEVEFQALHDTMDEQELTKKFDAFRARFIDKNNQNEKTTMPLIEPTFLPTIPSDHIPESTSESPRPS